MTTTSNRSRDNLRHLISSIPQTTDIYNRQKLSGYIQFESDDELQRQARKMNPIEYYTFSQKLKKSESNLDKDKSNRALFLLQSIKQTPSVIDAWFSKDKPMKLFVKVKVSDYEEAKSISDKISQMDSGLKNLEIIMPQSGFDCPTTLLDNTEHHNVYYDPNLSRAGERIAEAVLETCETDYKAIADYFGGITPKELPFRIIITRLSPNADGTMGAYHYGCDGVEIYSDIDITTKSFENLDLTRFLTVSQEVEVFAATQDQGWDCAKSNGEALSRVLATERYPQQLGNYDTARFWLESKDRPNFIDENMPIEGRTLVSTESPDKQYHEVLSSIGCSVLFLNFLHYHMEFAWKDIIAAGSNTLGQTYSKLTKRNDGFTKFREVIEKQFPIGYTSLRLESDNPFKRRGE